MSLPLCADIGTIRALAIQLLAEADHLFAVAVSLLAVPVDLLANVN